MFSSLPKTKALTSVSLTKIKSYLYKNNDFMAIQSSSYQKVSLGVLYIDEEKYINIIQWPAPLYKVTNFEFTVGNNCHYYASLLQISFNYPG